MNINENVIVLYHHNLGFSAESAKFYAFAQYIGLCEGKLEENIIYLDFTVSNVHKMIKLNIYGFHFRLELFKDICCRCIVCGKGLTTYLQIVFCRKIMSPLGIRYVKFYKLEYFQNEHFPLNC